MSSEAERLEVSQQLAKCPPAWRVWRQAVQGAESQQARLTPGQWQQLLAALAAFGAALLQIFTGGGASGPETTTAPQPVTDAGPCMPEPDGEGSEP